MIKAIRNNHEDELNVVAPDKPRRSFRSTLLSDDGDGTADEGDVTFVSIEDGACERIDDEEEDGDGADGCGTDTFAHSASVVAVPFFVTY